jgi:hypothetical protein
MKQDSEDINITISDPSGITLTDHDLPVPVEVNQAISTISGNKVSVVTATPSGASKQSKVVSVKKSPKVVAVRSTTQQQPQQPTALEEVGERDCFVLFCLFVAFLLVVVVGWQWVRCWMLLAREREVLHLFGKFKGNK